MTKRTPVKSVSDEERLAGALRTMAKENCPEEEFVAAFKTAMTSGSRVLSRGLRGTFKAMGNVLDNVQRVRKS